MVLFSASLPVINPGLLSHLPWEAQILFGVSSSGQVWLQGKARRPSIQPQLRGQLNIRRPEGARPRTESSQLTPALSFLRPRF
jgi:hypothetical protein